MRKMKIQRMTRFNFSSFFSLYVIFIEKNRNMDKNRVIRLTENELHQIVEESVRIIIEGQGANIASSSLKKAFSKEGFSKKPVDNLKSYISKGESSNDEKDPKFYDDEGNGTNDWLSKKKGYKHVMKSNPSINKSKKAKVGRAFGGGVANLAYGARKGIDKLTK